MLTVKFSKFKQVYALTFLPRLFLKESRFVKSKINDHCPVELLYSVKKSTDSKTRNENSTQTSGQDETIFPKNEIVRVKDDLSNKNIISPELYQIPRCTKCKYVISKLFGIKTNVNENIDNKNINTQSAKVNAVTGTIEEEKLVQKVETVNETPHVEAHPPNVEEVNSVPKILGQSISNIKPTDKKIVSEVILDELAKRCLDCSIGDIDNTLLNELKNISVNNLIPNDMIRKDQEKITEAEENEQEEPLNLRPTVNNFHEPFLKTNFEETDVYRNFMSEHISNILSTQQLLTNSNQSSGGWWSEGMSQQDDIHNSAISGTYEQLKSRKRRHGSVESPKNTAISANQNPGEYYDWRMQFSPNKVYIDTPRMIVENTVTQNVVLTEHLGMEISKEPTKVKEGVTDIKTYEKATVNMEQLENQEERLNSKNNIPLSILLKRIQEQSRLDYCRHIIAKTEAEVVTANKSNCPPPPDKKPARARPCKPKCKPKTTKNPCPCPCPEKKDPCAKFSPCFLNMVIKSNVCDLSIPLQYKTITPNNTSSLSPIIDIIGRFKKFGNIPNIWGFHTMNSICSSLNPETVIDPQT